MAEDTSTTPWVCVHLGDMDFHVAGSVKISNLLFPSAMTAGSHPVNQFGGLNAFELLCEDGLPIILNNQLDSQPRCDNQVRVDSCFTKACPMDLCSFVRVLTTKSEGFLMRPGSMVKALNSLHGVLHPETIPIRLQPGERCSSVGIQYLS